MDKQLQLSPYDPRWVEEFREERDRIARVVSKLAIRIDHNGSTSVPGLDAKPVIDIQISVRDLRPIDQFVEPLSRIGYVHVPNRDDSLCPFLHRPKNWPHTHHVHVVESLMGALNAKARPAPAPAASTIFASSSFISKREVARRATIPSEPSTLPAQR